MESNYLWAEIRTNWDIERTMSRSPEQWRKSPREEKVYDGVREEKGNSECKRMHVGEETKQNYTKLL